MLSNEIAKMMRDHQITKLHTDTLEKKMWETQNAADTAAFCQAAKLQEKSRKALMAIGIDPTRHDTASKYWLAAEASFERKMDEGA